MRAAGGDFGSGGLDRRGRAFRAVEDRARAGAANGRRAEDTAGQRQKMPGALRREQGRRLGSDTWQFRIDDR